MIGNEWIFIAQTQRRIVRRRAIAIVAEVNCTKLKEGECIFRKIQRRNVEESLT